MDKLNPAEPCAKLLERGPGAIVGRLVLQPDDLPRPEPEAPQLAGPFALERRIVGHRDYGAAV